MFCSERDTVSFFPQHLFHWVEINTAPNQYTTEINKTRSYQSQRFWVIGKQSDFGVKSSPALATTNSATGFQS